MADEADDPMVVQLREIRSELGGINGKLAEHDTRFDAIDRRFDDFQMLVNHALGVSTANQLKARELEVRQDDSEAQLRRMDAQFADIERRLSKVEEKLEG